MNVTTRRVTSPMSDEQLKVVAPSIFASSAHESRSDRYTHIPTIRVLEKLRENGFLPMAASQSVVRSDESRRDFTKHMVRFRHADSMSLQVGDVFPEVVMVNSHDGTSSYHLHAGLFRLVCGNGMIASSSSLQSVRVQHTGNVVREVLEGSFKVLEDSARAVEVSKKWAALQLTAGEQNALATAAHQLRFGDAQGNVNTPIRPSQLLLLRRAADNGNDLWRTFNRVQENVIRGGLHGHGIGADGRRRRVSSREVKGIDGNVNLNKALWVLAEQLASFKQN